MVQPPSVTHRWQNAKRADVIGKRRKSNRRGRSVASKATGNFYVSQFASLCLWPRHSRLFSKMAAARAAATLLARRKRASLFWWRSRARVRAQISSVRECLNTRATAPAAVALAAWMYAEVARLELGHSRRKAQTPRRQLSPKSRAASSGTKSLLRSILAAQKHTSSDVIARLCFHNCFKNKRTCLHHRQQAHFLE